MKPNRGLGKGLSALFSETEEDYGKSLLFDEENDQKTGVSEIEISSIRGFIQHSFNRLDDCRNMKPI